MLDCLVDFVGIRVCGTDPVPASGIYINSLPGISLESIDKIVNQDQVTYRNLWQDAQAEAATQFYQDFIVELRKCFSIQAYCDYENIICINKQLLVNAWKYLLGATLMEYRLYTNRLNRFSTVDRENANELLTLYQTKYQNALHESTLMCDVSSCCLHCGGDPQVVTWLP